jgi:hypothetical protein
MAENESQEPEESTPEVNEEVPSKVWSVNVQLRTVAMVNPRAVGVDADPIPVMASAITEMVSSVITERGLAHVEAIMAEEKPNGWSMIEVALQPKPTPQPDAETIEKYKIGEPVPEGYARGEDGLLRKKKTPYPSVTKNEQLKKQRAEERTVRDIVEDVPDDEPPC